MISELGFTIKKGVIFSQSNQTVPNLTPICLWNGYKKIFSVKCLLDLNLRIYDVCFFCYLAQSIILYSKFKRVIFV